MNAPLLPRVLVVDDDVIDREMIKRLIGDRFDLIEAGRATEGERILAEEPLDCVLIDYTLPDRAGTTLLPVAHDHQVGAVMLTGMTGESPAIASLRGGAHDYISKHDLTREGLESAIRNSIEKAQLERELQLYKQVVESMPVGIGVASWEAPPDPGSFRFLAGNDAWARATRRCLDDLLGHTARDAMPDELAAGVFERFADAHRTGRPQPLPPNRWGSPEAGETWELQVSPLYGDLVLILSEDVSKRERARAERERLEHQMRGMQRMEALGRLVAGVAHDFNNILTVIQGYGELLLADLEEAAPGRADLTQVMNAADRGTSLIKQLLAFSRKQVLQLVVQDLNGIIDAAEPLLRRLVGPGVRLRVRPGEVLHPVEVDASQMEQVLMNLAANARDAMPDGGELIIETRNVQLGEEYGSQRGVPITPGDYVLLAITDTGVGMSEATRAHVFEPFFTTKGRGKGTGLGLSTVYGIVRQSGGFIWVYSEPDHGTTFRVYLPKADGEPAEAGTGGTVLQLDLDGDETILVVEDDDLVQETTRRILERHGYQVQLASSAEAAALPRGAVAPDVLVTDAVMPDVNGRELAELLTKRYPDLAVVIMSGYTDEVLAHRGRLTAGSVFLQKPFTPTALLRALREALARREG